MSLLGIYPKGPKHLYNTLIPVLIMALFTIITLWGGEPRCLSTDQQMRIKKIWSATKRNEIISFA